MKITRAGNSWEQWQERVLGFALAWWLFVAPSVAHALWPVIVGGKMPAPLASLLNLSPCWVVLGFVLAVAALSTDFHEYKTVQRIARWFMLGTCALPILFALLSQ